MRKHVISGLLALLFLLALPLSAAAHAVPDESRNGHCSITISMTYKGKAVRGGTLALYKVGDVAEDDGNYSFVPVEEIQADIPEFGDIESPDLAGRLAEADRAIAHLLAVSRGLPGLYRGLLVCDRVTVELLGEARPAVLADFLTQGQVKVRLHRCRERLRKYLRSQEFDL